MKKNLAAALLAFALSAWAAIQATAQESRLIYSCDTGKGIPGNMGGVGAPLKQDYDVAMKVDGKLFKGLTVEAIRVPLGEMTGLSGLKVWLTKSLKLETIDGKKTNVPDITTQDAETAEGWVEVKLAQPYTLTGEDIFAGYSIKMDELNETNKRPVKITTETHDGGCHIHSSRSYRSWTDFSQECGAAMQVVLGGAPENAAAVSAEGAYFGAAGKKTFVTFVLDNHGAAGIKSVDYTYEYDGKTLTGHSDLALPVSSVYNASAYFSFTLPEVARKDYYPLSLTVTKVNGKDNTDAGKSLTQRVSIFDVVPKHRAVLEEYSGTWCGNCPRGFVGMEVMNRLYPEDFIALSYHYDDPMQVMSYEYFPNTPPGYPSSYLDRQYDVDPYGGVDGNAKQLGIDRAWLAACEMVAEASIDTRAWLSDDKASVTATANVTFPLAVDKAKYAVELVLVADGLTGTTEKWLQTNYYAKGALGTFPEPEFEQFTSGGKYVSGLKYNDVVVATTRLTTGNIALPTSIEADKTYNAEAKFSLGKVTNISLDPIIQDKKNLRVVALLVNNATGAVVNAAKAKVLENEAAGITAMQTGNGQTGATAIYDLSGRRTDRLTRGVNIIRTADGRTYKQIVK